MSIKLIKSILPPHYTSLYVAVSMGVDSLSSYFFLQKLGYNVIPLHFNHKLRKQNDLMEGVFFRCFNEEYKAGKNSFVNDLIGRAKKSLLSETECRIARMEYFKSIIPNGGYLVTGHHLDDFVESYLLNCLRGKPNHFPINLVTDFVSFKILHPFLLTNKADLINFAAGKSWEKYIVVDETNAINKGSRRNWLRNTIIPELEKNHISLKKYCKSLINDKIKELEENEGHE